MSAHQLEIVDPKSLTHDIGGKWHRSYGTAPCPVCQPSRNKTQNALTIRADGTRLLLHCKKSGCDFKDILSGAGLAKGSFEVSPRIAQEMEQERAAQAARSREYARKVWAASAPLEGTHGAAYLRARGITCPLPATLRWANNIHHGPTDRTCAAIVADVAETGGVHRTFFTHEGRRLDQSAKMMLGPCSGGAVRLSEALGPLVVCEGIETGLSLMSGLLSGPHAVWAALSTSGMKGLVLPTQPSRLIVASDGDDAGRSAANELAMLATRKGWKVSILAAPDGQDWNDVLQSEVAA